MSKNEVCTTDRLWATLIDHEVLGSVHHFDEIDRATVLPTRGAKTEARRF